MCSILVSVLFSEPKIPQSPRVRRRTTRSESFSALQRAENSSIPIPVPRARRLKRVVSVLFSEPKIPQLHDLECTNVTNASFSALQRAENSSILRRGIRTITTTTVSVLFSEPKIPQCTLRDALRALSLVSVLFSEPKIPQSRGSQTWTATGLRFSALQRAENSSMTPCPVRVIIFYEFQCSSASRKFLNPSNVRIVTNLVVEFQCSSASRKFLNGELNVCSGTGDRFQCSSASRKFLNPSRPYVTFLRTTVSVLFSEPKIPQFHN